MTGREPLTANADAAHSSLSRLLTVREVADLLQVPPKTIYTWRYKRIGPPAVVIGKYLRFRTEDVVAWLEMRADHAPRGIGARRGAATEPLHRRIRPDGTR